MKHKNIKVAYTSRSSGGSYAQVPKIQMEGRWLEELGFSIGSTIVVEYDDSSIRIRQMTEEELAVFRRGRNAQVHSIPSHASRAQYSTATALEALFGWLYLGGQRQRASDLFDVMMEE